MLPAAIAGPLLLRNYVSAVSWDQAGCWLHHSVPVCCSRYKLARFCLSLSWAAPQRNLQSSSNSRPQFVSQECRGKSLCWTSSLKLGSQQRATEGNGEGRKLLSWHQQFAVQQPWATILPVCSSAQCCYVKSVSVSEVTWFIISAVWL